MEIASASPRLRVRRAVPSRMITSRSSPSSIRIRAWRRPTSNAVGSKRATSRSSAAPTGFRLAFAAESSVAFLAFIPVPISPVGVTSECVWPQMIGRAWRSIYARIVYYT